MENMRRGVFPVEPTELVEILHDHSVEKRWIARGIKWNKGTDKAGIALLADARQRLHRLPTTNLGGA